MADAIEQKARRAVRAAQARFEREQRAAQKARRMAFAEAREAGLMLRAIGEESALTTPESAKSSEASNRAWRG